MKNRFVADGEERLQQSEAFQKQLRDLRDSIHARNALELSKAGFLRRFLMRITMWIEFRRERKRIVPSPYALNSSRPLSEQA